jgi:hypothetical protein
MVGARRYQGRKFESPFVAEEQFCSFLKDLRVGISKNIIFEKSMSAVDTVGISPRKDEAKL